MKKRMAACGAAFFMLVSLLLIPSVRSHASTSFTTLLDVWILNGKVDASPVGSSVASSGNFTTITSTSGSINAVVGGTTPAPGAFTSLSSTTGSINASIGGTTPSTAAFTTATATSFTGALNGNASSATQLAVSPTQCSGGQYATGVSVTGNAFCASFPTFTGTSGYQSLTSGLVLAWGNGTSVSGDSVQGVAVGTTGIFPHACLTAWAVNLDPSQTTNITKSWAIVSCSGNTVTVELQRRGDEGSFSAQPRAFAIGW